MLAWLVLGLPLLACLVLSLWPGEPDRRVTRLVGVGLPAIGFVLTLVIFGILLGRDAEDRDHVTTLWGWVRSDGLDIDLALLVDPLSVLMMLVVTGVGSLIVLYSTEYMEHEERPIPFSKTLLGQLAQENKAYAKALVTDMRRGGVFFYASIINPYPHSTTRRKSCRRIRWGGWRRCSV